MKCNQFLFSDTRTEILLTRLIENLKVLDFSQPYLSRSPVKVNRLSHGILIIPRLTQQLLQISKDQQKNFCLLREDKCWYYISGIQFVTPHLRDQSWSNYWGRAAKFFLAQIDHESWGISLNDEEPSNKTTPKTKLTNQNKKNWCQLNCFRQILQFTCACNSV